jgi:glycine/D-amino acid oxidase-like deaminating enzyme
MAQAPTDRAASATPIRGAMSPWWGPASPAALSPGGVRGVGLGWWSWSGGCRLPAPPGRLRGCSHPCSEAPGPGPFLDLARHSLGLWPALTAALLEEGGIDCELDTGGVLRVALEEADIPRVRERLAWQHAAGVAVEWLDRGAAASAAPALPKVAGAALYHGEGHVHVATGHFRNGVLLAPATAQGMASMVLDGVRPAGWDAFDPRRCTARSVVES